MTVVPAHVTQFHTGRGPSPVEREHISPREILGRGGSCTCVSALMISVEEEVSSQPLISSLWQKAHIRSRAGMFCELGATLLLSLPLQSHALLCLKGSLFKSGNTFIFIKNLPLIIQLPNPVALSCFLSHAHFPHNSCFPSRPFPAQDLSLRKGLDLVTVKWKKRAF